MMHGQRIIKLWLWIISTYTETETFRWHCRT